MKILEQKQTLAFAFFVRTIFVTAKMRRCYKMTFQVNISTSIHIMLVYLPNNDMMRRDRRKESRQKEIMCGSESRRKPSAGIGMMLPMPRFDYHFTFACTTKTVNETLSSSTRILRRTYVVLYRLQTSFPIMDIRLIE